MLNIVGFLLTLSGCSALSEPERMKKYDPPILVAGGKAMTIRKYNKLVRDRIPEIIEASGKTCTTEILSAEAYLRMLDTKMDEELAEYHRDQNIEELADLLEVIRAAAAARGYSLDDLERIRAEKAEKRGGFEKRILLVEVQEG